MDNNTTGAPRDTTTALELNKQMLGKVAKTMYTQSLALNEKIRTLSILQAIDKLTLESKRELSQLGGDISEAITDSSKFTLVSIFSAIKVPAEDIVFQGWSVDQKYRAHPVTAQLNDLMSRMSIPITEEWMSSNLRHQVIPIDTTFNLLGTSFSDEETQLLRDTLTSSFDVRCLYVTKLKMGDHIIGLLVVGLEEPAPHLDDIELIERIGNTTGIALSNRLLYEQNAQALEQLQHSNEKLKSIDAAKDEFVALASHQLRTPLTSMKGYVSMVLEGDYGDINDAQKDALQKSFNSAQRMVYLVSDLLNVSRLQTGKFSIINSPTDLATIVKEECDQLQESAAMKKITMSVEIQPDIPKLMLDGNKVRQVIMNLIDNALYYTLTGGSVAVRLVKNDEYVSFTVTDNGVGVPQSEQQNLFKKFYRATNAKQARPDGTGLGLYMAAKVVQAQGGQLLFVSKENVGSTFGFRLRATG